MINKMKKLFTIFSFLLVLLVFYDFSASKEMDPEKCAEKTEGWFWQGLPLVNFNSDDGFGYGVRVLRVYDGAKNDEYYCSSPYFFRLTGQFFQTTNWRMYHFIEADMPYFMGTKWRFKTSFIWDESLNANYFGTGPKSSNKLRDYSGKSYDTFENYNNHFLKEPCENYKYNKYHIRSPKWFLSTYLDITSIFRLFIGAEFKYTRLMPWGGEQFDLNGHSYTANQTLIEAENLQNQDGWVNSVKAGIAFDTRDHEVDPRRGIFIDYTVRCATFLLGSGFDFIRNTLGARFYVTPVKDLTFALRIAYTTTTSDTPFHEKGNFDFMYETQSALGNNRTLRGYPANRFIGNTMTNGNMEIRYEFAQTKTAGQLFEFKVLAFIDTGSVFDNPDDPFRIWNYYHTGAGGGLAIVWNQSFLLHIYYGRALNGEDSSVSIDFSHAI